MSKLKIWHFSDSHTYHSLLKVPECDMAIFSGDATNPRDPYSNEQEFLNFIEWYGILKIPYKVLIAGNHDTSVEKGFVTREKIESKGLIYLEHETKEIAGLQVFGSPYTPSFGFGWAFNKRRDKLYDMWQEIPENADIVITHGPPKGVLDLSFDPIGKLEFCGCKSLKDRILAIKPKLVCFGHIHSMKGIDNQGYTKLANSDTIYSNGSVVEDGKFGKISSHGNIFEL